MTRSFRTEFTYRRVAMALPLMALTAACSGPLDYDLRGQIGAFNTSQAAQTATESRPTPDARGLITYPSYQVAVARRGDTVSSLADRVGLPAGEIARLNGVQPTDTLRKDEVMVLPRRAPDVLPAGLTGTAGNSTANPGGVDIAALAGNAIDSADANGTAAANPGAVSTSSISRPNTTQPRSEPSAPAQVQDGPEPVQHKVTRGETAYTISRLYQVPVKSLAEWNGLSSDFAVREGQMLLIPIKDESAAPVARPAVVEETSAPGEGSLTPEPPSATKPLPTEIVAPAATSTTAEPVAAEPAVEVQAPTRASQSAMGYPVQGKILRTYSKGKSDGIDIAGTEGAPVKAAEAGSVAAITKDSNGVPFLVIRHDNDLLTVYSHVDGIRVRQGERVDRGQTIAVLRKDEGGQAYVHFQIRDGLESINPLPYLQ